MARALILTATDRRRGAEVFTVRLAEGLKRLGWEVDTASLTSSGDERRVDVEPLTNVSSARPGRLNREIRRAVRNRIEEIRPDVVVANGGSTLRYGALAARSTSAPVVYIAIGEPDYWIRSAWSRAANRWMLGKTAMVLAVCDATRRQLIALAPGLEDRIRVTYTGVPDEMFAVRRTAHEGPLRVAMIGSLSDEKDPLLAVAAVSEVPGVVLRLVGGGPLEQRVRDEARRLGVEDRVELAEVADDVRPHLEWASVLLLTSQTEGLPGAVLEAGAASVPSVAVDVGGVREAIRDGVTGMVVERSLTSITSALAALVADPATARRLGKAARLDMKKRFAMEPIVSGYAACLTEVIR